MTIPQDRRHRLTGTLTICRKIILCGVFSLGFLVVSPNHPPPEIPLPFPPPTTNSSPIQPPLTPSPHPQILSAVLNRYYNFTAGFGSLIYLNWYVGEAATSVFVANVPHLWPLLSRLFSLSAFLSARRTAGSGSTPANDHSSRFHNKVVNAQRRHLPSSGYLRTESEERIIAGKYGGGGGGTWPLSGSNTSAGSEGVVLEMGRMDGEGKGMGMGYVASAAAGGGDEEKGEVRDGIVRTVQIRQYSS